MTMTSRTAAYAVTPPAARSATVPLAELMERTHLTPADLDTLRTYADLLVPADGEAPSFSEADGDQEVLPLAIEQVGHWFAEALAALSRMAGDTPGARLAALERDAPQTFRGFRDVVVCWYLSTQRVWELVGYDGRKPRPPRPGEAEMYLVGGILDPVRQRGPIYTLPDT